jgi:salicylate hydroxylase
MTYQMAAGAKFNMVLSHIDHSDPSTWTEKYDKDDVLAEFSGWDPQSVNSSISYLSG